MRILSLGAVTGLCYGLLLADVLSEEKAPESLALDSVVFDADLWGKQLAEIKEQDEEAREDDGGIDIEVDIEDMEELREVIIDQRRGSRGFQWLSSNQDGLRSSPGSFTLLGEEVGEVVLRSAGGKTANVSVSVFNRGDDGNLPMSTFEKRYQQWKRLLDEKLQVRSEERDSKGAVKIRGWIWRKGDSAYLLESSINRSEKRAEFIRLRVASISAAKNKSGKVAKRSSLEDNVREDDAGYTYVEGVPMVDQGEKGYCVVASIERMARYFGLEVDQHEMAQVANTSERGTSGNAMEKAFQRITGRIHVRTIKLIEFDYRQLERDVRGYNRAARRAGVPKLNEDLYSVNPTLFWARADPVAFRDMKARQNRCDHFMRKIKEYVDQGVPLCWTLYLGMFKEEGIPQISGGHMRLITGYNYEEGKPPMILYTDSWGAGHERKTMRADEAYCMTMALYAMVPSQ